MKIGDKYFLNLQEAVAWLLANNALPFQCNVNYVANTEIAKTAIINPSPAEIKVGALVLFADSKVGTVSGLTSNGFMVGPDYTDIKNALNYISNVAVDGSGYLVVTFSDGSSVNAGLLKQVLNFSINASQHLIANYNDGTSTDLGAIFTGNISISGNITASGIIDGATVTGNNIVEKMAGYSTTIADESTSDYTLTYTYVGVCKTGNKITFVIAGNIAIINATGRIDIGGFVIPSAVGSKIYGSSLYGWVDIKNIDGFADYSDSQKIPFALRKYDDANLALQVYFDNCETSKTYYFRYECTLLLSDPL